MTAGSLTVGTDDSNAYITHDDTDLNFANGGLILKRGGYRHNRGNVAFKVDGNVTVASPASNPFFIHQQQQQYPNASLTFRGAFSGAEGTGVVFGPRSRMSGTTSRVIATNMTITVNDPSGYKGNVEVSSRITFNDNSNGGTTLKLGSLSTPGSFSVIDAGAVVSPLSATDVIQASSMSYASGCRLVFTCDDSGHASLLKATSSLTVASGVQVKVEHAAIAAGTYPLLQGPSGSSFTKDDFILLNPELEFDVVDDGSVRSLVLVASRAYVMLTKSDVFGKDTGANFHSAITNAACWSDGRVPHEGAVYVVPTGFALRTPKEVGVCEFGGDALMLMNGSRLTLFGECLAVEKLVVPSGSAAEIFIGQGLQNLASQGVTNTSIVATNVLVDGKLSLGAYTSRRIGIDAPVSGTGEIVMCGVDGSSAYTGYYSFGADNSGFTGRMRLSLHQTLQNQGHTNQVFTVYSATDFGGNRAAFDYKAMTVELGGHLDIQKPRTNPSGDNSYNYVAPTNCGLYVSGSGDMNVNYAVGNLVWPSSLTLDGTFRKRGSGRLALGSPTKFLSGGNLSDTPTEGKNVIDWEGGRIHPLVHDAIDGVQLRLVATSQNGFVHLKLEQDYSDPLLMRYGIKNTKTATPFSISNASVFPKLPLEVVYPPEPADAVAFTVGLVTVADSAADTVRALLPPLPAQKIYDGFSQEAVEIRENGMTTFAVEFSHKGTSIIFR